MFKLPCCFTLALFLSAVYVIAQSQPSASNSAPTGEKTDLATISGRVVRSTDGVPLKKATILAAQTGQRGPVRPKSAITDADGKFVLKDLDPGRYMLTATRNGYARQSYGQRDPLGPGTAITLINGQQLKDIMFRMIPAGVIAGRIVDEDGEPVYQARIEAQRWMYMRGKRQLIPGGFATTNDLGEYRLAQLAPGRYFISASLSPQFQSPGSAAPDAHEGYSQTFYPGVYDAAQADPLEVKGGTEIGGINLRLVPTHAVTIRGTVKGTMQKEGINVQLMPKGEGYRRMDKLTMVDDKGGFEIGGVLPGAYNVIAISYAEDKRMFAMQTIDVADSDIDGINLLLKPGADIPGRLRIEGNLTLKDSRVRVILRSEDPAAMMFGGMGGTLEDDMTFIMKGYSDGDYRLSVWGLPEDAYVRSASMGSRDILDEPLHLTGAVRPLDIVISANGGRVEGAVTDSKGNPFTSARVVLVPDEARRKRQDLFKTGSTDQYGHFSLRGVAPGAYTIYAWESLDGDAYMDPDFLKLYADSGKSVRVSESSQVTADLKIISAQSAEGN